MQFIDVVVIGSGVVGAAIGRELSLAGYQTAILERASGPGSGVSCTSAGILASGFDRPADALETRLMREGAKRWPAVFESLGIPYKRTGALAVALYPQDVARFASILENAEASGIIVQPIDSRRLRQIEPHVRGRAALSIAEEAITDPFEVNRRLLSMVPVHYNAEVLAVEQRVEQSALIRLEFPTITARAVINCAGLYGDKVAADDSFQILPRRGDFVVYAPASPPIIEHILRPIDRQSGVLVFPTLYGYVVAGPSSVDQNDREDWRPRGLREVREAGARLLPALSHAQPADAWAGIRPAGAPHDYCIDWSPRVSAMLNVGAIRGTGLSACLGIAAYVRERLAERDILPRGKSLAVTATQYDAPRPWWERHKLQVRAKPGVP